MKRKNISETIGNISLKYIDEANEYKGKNAPSKAWYKWVAVAACLVLVLGAGFPFAKDLFVSPDHKETVDAVMMIEYEGAYLEIIEDSKTIERLGLPEKITKDVIGNHIAYLQKTHPEAERSDYIAADKKTDTELYEYAPAPYKAVRIFREGEKYFYAYFCNFLISSDESLPVEKAFEIYGIDEASDIVSITPSKLDNLWKANGKVVTDSVVISEFFNEISKLAAYSFDEYHEIVFADELKKYEDVGGGDVGDEVYTRVADDRKDIVIQTKEGLHFAINYYPTYSWINISKTISYYRMSPEIIEWFENNIK